MHFTVSFSGPEHRDLSYGLVFVPSPVWVAGDREILNLHLDNPYLQRGAVARLTEREGLKPVLAEGRRCTVVVHSEGNGSPQDLETLLEDLRAEGFSVSVAGVG